MRPYILLMVKYGQLLVLVVFVVFYAPRDAHAGFTMAAFQDLGPNIRLGIAGIITVCSEWLAW